MIVLGIESSCDETGIALYDNRRGLLAHRIFSQIDTHQDYGGVVPELASRDHVRKALPLIQETLNAAQLDKDDIDAIAYTAGPGLVGALMVGAAIARSLAFSLGIPALGVHHMEGHLLAALLEIETPAFPFVALLVSGGHTQLMAVSGVGDYQILGESLDDAAGEAFDKTAKLLGLPYPGGPALAQFAQKGNPERFRFPRPMTDRPGLDFSFSGLKTFALTTLKGFAPEQQSDQLKADIARAFEDAVVETLLIKCRRALEQTGYRHLVLAGGVSANQQLRQQIAEMTAKLDARAWYPRPEFCTDNGAMIAYAGCLRLAAGEQGKTAFEVRPRWAMEELQPLASEAAAP